MTIKIKDLTTKNFLSVGNATQAVSFDKEQLTLVLGENLDLGGDDSGAKNGTGKCVCASTLIKVRDTRTGVIQEIAIGDLYAASTKKLK